MEAEVGFYPAGKVKEHDLSPVGIEFTNACTNAGLPIRPPPLPLQPIHVESSETLTPPEGSPTRNASAELVAALGRKLTEPLDMEETPGRLAEGVPTSSRAHQVCFRAL